MFIGNTDPKVRMSPNSDTLPVINEVKDLGVVVDTDILISCLTLILIRLWRAHLVVRT